MRSAYEDPPEYRSPGGPGGGLALPTMTPVTRRLLWINGIVFLLSIIFVERVQLAADFFNFLKLQPSQWENLFPFVPFWQLLSYGFLHDIGGVGHLFFNLLGLYFFGTLLEGMIGPNRFLTVYLVGIAVGGVVHLVIELIWGTGAAVLGASGGVLCLIVASATMRPDARVIFIIVPMTLKALAMILVALDVVGLLIDRGVTAHWVHLSGGVWGFVSARRRWIWWDPIQAWSARREAQVQQAGQRDQERLDELLKQIHEKGIQSLSRRDRDFLKRVSQRK